MIVKAKKELKETFGYDTFRPLQEEVISQVLKKKDALVIMPTGGGKSLCYQIPALLFEGLTIVVSPLISLMKDQVEQLREYDINAVHLNSSLSPEAYAYNVRQVQQGKAKLLYVAPETLLMDRTKELLSNLKIDCFTIDEAHCISEWGHDFRPEYRQLAEVRKTFSDAVCIALTATATPRVREDIKKTLELKDSEEFIASFDRKNLFLKIVDKKDPLNQVLDFLYTRKKQSGIIYCISRRQVDELAYELELEGYSVKPYHAGLSDRDRAINQRAFIRDDVSIIVATIAFGMGINKPNVRFVMHYDMPQNIESYYQQIGRAGRDGLRSDCVLLFSTADTHKIKYFINQKEGQEKKVAEEHLEELLKFLNTTQCRRKPLMSYFGEKYPNDECGMCDNCVASKEGMEDFTVQAQKYLSCVVRTGEMFGKNYIGDILRGSKRKKILENKHDSVSTYGIGREWSRDQWDQFARLLLRQEYLYKDENGSLKLGDKATAILEGSESVYGILDRTSVALTGEEGARTSSEVEAQYDESLFELLRLRRKELADEKGIPPTSIFPDTTLMEMAYYFPQTKESLSHLYGVGSAKLNNYGDPFIGVIKKYSAQKGIQEKKRPTPKKSKKVTRSGEKYILIGEAFNNGQTIEHLAEEYGVKDVTILNHLKTYLTEGKELRIDGLLEHANLSERQQNDVMKAIKKVGPELLKPVYEQLNKAIGYDQLRIMQLYYMANESS